MELQSSTRLAPEFAHLQQDSAASSRNTSGTDSDQDQTKLREVFDQFVGQTFFHQMLSAMRKTVDKPAYFHGGRAEEVFQSQLDQVLADRMSAATADEIAGPMFELFNLRRN